MLAGLLILILKAVGSFVTSLLLVRALMRWQRLSFINPLGHFILATTDWAVRPAQKVFGSQGGFDLSCIVPAWLVECLVVGVVLLFAWPYANPLDLLGNTLLTGSIGLLMSLVRLVMVVVIVAAVLSWVNPRAPIAPLVNGLARPFLLPLQRRMPPVGGVDLSPLVLLLVLQVIAYLLMAVAPASIALM
ncbi:YggT family protein [Niveibacterium umoris]|uniref:YggT family protein n=1 Tax=Niveibacterium umoris TaxID=1193620 RepID=A0A840BKR6_9RHOO|nr:YggT family protein [Niveibacterium umoris]MBB4013213.1 YggT family protein [Niveibacterium umoris]